MKNDFRLFHFGRNLYRILEHEDGTLTVLCCDLPKHWNGSFPDPEVQVEWTIGKALNISLKLEKKRFLAKKTFFFKLSPSISPLKNPCVIFAYAIREIQITGKGRFERILDLHGY
jgi:hypothetical protein